MARRKWVRLPTWWIANGGLKSFIWANKSALSALMVLVAIAHESDDAGVAQHVTYDSLERTVLLSRAKISAGLKMLLTLGIIEKNNLRSAYTLARFDPAGGWAAFPVRSMYNPADRIEAFEHFHLRAKAELDALKILFLLVVRRDRTSNLSNISYSKIHEYSGVPHGRIKAGLSLLTGHSLIYTEHQKSNVSELGVSNAYRIVGIETRKHAGTHNRDSL